MKTSIAEEREGRGRAAAIFLFCGRCVVCILAARGRNALGCQKCGAHSQKRESPHPSAIVVRPVLHWSAPLLSAPLAAFVRKAVTGRMGAGQMTAPSEQTPLLGSEPQVTTPGAHVSTCCSGGRTFCWICPRVRTSARRRNGVDVIASPLRPRRLQGGGRVRVPTHADLLPVGFRLRGFRNLTDSLLV